MAYLVLVRHGQSEWNAKNWWTGWRDIPLSEKGREEARSVAEKLKGIKFDAAFTSALCRAQQTLTEILTVLGQAGLPATADLALNERNYGDYTGHNKLEIKKQLGEEVYDHIHRGWDYFIPNGESLKDVYQRVVPYYQQFILPELKTGKNVLISAHGNSLRALVKYLDNIPDDQICKLEIATGEALVYQLDAEGKVLSKESRRAQATPISETDQLIILLETKEKLVAMLAPSFPIVYQYPQIVSQLKGLGFTYVVEVAAGAKKTNEEVAALLQANPEGRYIASPCPGFVRLVRNKFPQLEKFLAFQADSPMVATAKIVREKYPGFKPVFIGPCFVKKVEATEDYADLNILVLTYKEMEEVFAHFNLPENTHTSTGFDLSESSTRTYPADGGLTESSGIKKILTEEEMRIVSGEQQCEAALEEFQNNPKIRFLDILLCEGGCISGTGIESELTLEERKQKILNFAKP